MSQYAKTPIGILCLAMAGLYAGTTHAQDAMIPGGTENFKLSLGGALTTNNSNLRIDGTGNRGTDIDLEGLTGLEDSVSTFALAGSWRFAPNHRVSFAGFQIERDNSRNIDRQITIGDTVIPINTNLKTETRTQVVIVNYLYSFVRNESMELAGTVGIYGANYKYKFTANNPVVDVQRSTPAPLPVIGLAADFFLTPRWTVNVFAQGLKLNIGDVDGSLYNVGIATDYMFTRNLGVGLGYQVADLGADVTKSDFNGSINWRMDGYFAYLHMKF